MDRVIDKLARTIAQRLSLRAPQAASLEILAEVLATINLTKEPELEATLRAVQAPFPQVEAFERDFPSLCFSLATGVGKTRLMGAFISYLFLSRKSRHFFVLAPNKTVYEKLISDFTPGTEKYVFKGISELAETPPLIITGDDYESGRGLRLNDGRSADLFGSDLHVNIFNIDKINKEENGRGVPRMKQLQETIGDSYYNYLSRLEDLVLLMDEAHRYRASAGARAIDGLRPILGLELTATPKTVGANPKPFRNVIYSYGLGQAMADGLVKEPAVATRKDFNPSSVSTEKLEEIKLEDAVHYHDHVAVTLDRFHRATGMRKVHPFILVVAQDTDHARRIRSYVESEGFFQGRFRGRVAEVHSAQRGVESEEAAARLVALERDDLTDIVIHVNKLKEGWDVNNLYTIVPLRASASDILTEQTLGRGLRLPYGGRVSQSEDDEFAAVDRLTVIAHDRFDEIIAKAKEPGSVVMRRIEIGAGEEIPSEGTVLVEAPSLAQIAVSGFRPQLPGVVPASTPTFEFRSAEESRTAEVTLEVIRRFERKLGGVESLQDSTVQGQIAREVEELITPVQPAFSALVVPRIREIVEFVSDSVARHTISIPQVVVLPKRDIGFGFDDFDLADLDTINLRPIEDGLVIQALRTEARLYLAKILNGPKENRAEDYLVRFLIEQNEVDYDANADLLYKLAGQLVARLQEYLTSPADVENVLLRSGRELAKFIFGQMMQHYRETELSDSDYEVRMTRGFTLLKPQSFAAGASQAITDYRAAVRPLSATKRAIFGGFHKCCYPLQKFDSDPERRFAVLLETDTSVTKWIKPGPRQFQIEYRSGEAYEPDFVVESNDASLICEIKSRNEMQDEVVRAKAKAASAWSNAALLVTGRKWEYLLIADDAVSGAATLAGLRASYRVTSS